MAQFLHCRGPTLAKDAYKGSPFKFNRQYAESFGNKWIILSAKYGFILPDFEIPGPYEVTFKRKSSDPVSRELLRKQVKDQGLVLFPMVIGLGGKEYRLAIEDALQSLSVAINFPFAGLPIGKAMQATKIATLESLPQTNDP
ncbi:MAG: DUF6884 domain-containing protein [Pirellula sp.]